MIIIEVKESGSIERALRAYKRKFDTIKIMKDLRGRKEFTKKSVKNREERKKAIYIEKKNLNDL